MTVGTGDLVPARFTEPENPIVMGASKPAQTGNPVLSYLSRGCSGTGPCRGGITGLGEFEVPLIGVTAPGAQWMYLIGIGAVAALWLMRKK